MTRGTATPSTPLLSRRDLVAALCRNEEYIRDFEKIRQWIIPALCSDEYMLTFGKRPGDISLSKLQLREEGVTSYFPPPDAAEAEAAIISFLDRWPMLRKPIPPEMGRSDTVRFVGFVRNAAETVPGPRGKRGGVHVLRDGHSLRFASSHDISQGRFLPLQIDLTRPIEEIVEEVKVLVADHQIDWEESRPGLGINVPPSGAKKSVQKPKSKRPDRWLAFDVFMDPARGNRSARETAKIVFPDSYRFENDDAEVKEYLRERCRQSARVKSRCRGWACTTDCAHFDAALAKVRVTPDRQGERERHDAWVAAAVHACERLIASQLPVPPLTEK